MARVTVEDCIEVVENRFELVVLAARRGKEIATGVPITVSKDNDKNAVIALREIAARNINVELLREELIQSFQKEYKSTKRNESIEELSPELEEEIRSELTKTDISQESFYDQDMQQEDLEE